MSLPDAPPVPRDGPPDTRHPGVGPLGRRLSRWLAWQSLAGLALVCGGVYLAAALSFEARQQEALQDKQSQLRHLLAEASAADPATLRHKLDDALIGHETLSLRLQRADGTLFYQHPQRAGDAADAASGPNAPQRQRRFELPQPGQPRQQLQATLALDTADDQRLLRRLGLTLATAALLGAAIVAIGGHALVRLGLRPVHALVAQTRRLAADTLHHRLDGSAQPEELRPLVEQFNALLGRLDRSYAQLEAFNADVAHELNTPLAVLIGRTELALRKTREAPALREVLADNLEDLQRIAGIVQDMLFLSRADRGAQARRQPVASLAQVAAQMADYHEAALSEAGLRLRVQGDAAGAFDLPLLQRALSNLLANATRHARPGSTLEILIEPIAAKPGDAAKAPNPDVEHHVRSSAAPGACPEAAPLIALLVRNAGEPIAPPHLARLFERFYRGDAARSADGSGHDPHHGLGLAIVAAIARMHGGAPIAHSEPDSNTIGLSLRIQG